MVRIYKQAKIVLMGLFILYLSLNIYRIFQDLTLQQEHTSFMALVSGSPLCAAHDEVIHRLEKLTADLIHIRMIVDKDPTMARQIDSYYNNLQKLHREIQFITNKQHRSKRQKNNQENLHQDHITPVVCPEIYHGSTFGYPLYDKGFDTTNCSRKPVPVKNLVTLIFDDVPVVTTSDEGEVIAGEQHYHEKMTEFINKIDHFYPGIKINIVVNKTENIFGGLKSKIRRKGLTFTNIGVVSRGRILQELIELVDTPYLVIANQLSHFTSEVNIERLIRVLLARNSTLFVGGSSRNLTGHWSNNCYRLQLRNYTLTYKPGYERSFNECLVCGHLSGPFLTRTKTMQAIKFDQTLNYGIYEDLFLRLKYQRAGSHGNAVLSCPDVMFHVQKQNVEDIDLLPFANRHVIRKIIEADGKVRWYGCRRDIKHRLGDRCVLRDGLAVAPCCLENLADAIKFIMSECDSNNAVCELQEGTLLGAVKLNKVLPWERDADITFLTSDYEKIKETKKAMLERGYLFRDISSPWCCVEDRMAGGKIEILADGWSIQMYGQHRMDSERLKNMGVRPTKVQFCGEWVNVPENPGKHVRNRYGYGIYKHAEHWMSSGAKSGWINYQTKNFAACPVQGFHGCLDQYHPDGSVQFDNWLG